eukprot:Plantae.Rhodophyta-Palmaria_palmata.ctg6466.p2 GENE.Plantae.Rhodophyta-Palmaria_palmata.ctg6466~~Plantae.Rhodophyta-Palmaria_palmata.ctg6466.p2  ORF type:complete len:134 (+),score=10.78 Plantae.Rhodophyta-Palmaria_palmata.ctg6466:48-449(+)
MMDEKEEDACREAFLPALFVVLNGLATTKSMAVGRSGSYPGTVGGVKIRASAFRCCMPKRRPSASLLAYLPRKERLAGNASHLKQMVVRRSCLATRPQPVKQAATAWTPNLSRDSSSQKQHRSVPGVEESSQT